MTEAYSIPTNERSIEIGTTTVTKGIISQIGNTPLIPISNIPNLQEFQINSGVEIYAKAEMFNPGGSVKDRAAWYMIKEGLESGELTTEKTIVDASSGNTGIALAMIGSALGIDVKIFIPKNASQERLATLKAYGADLELTDPLEGTDGAIKQVRDIVEHNPEDYFYTDQYNNDANWRAHYNTTGPEIRRQIGKDITHFITGLGTSGTFMGISKYLKEHLSVDCTSIEPDSPFHGVEGMKHMESSITPGIYEPDFADNNIEVSTADAQKMTRQLAKEEGILVGTSSGANLVACLEIAHQLDSGYIVTIFPDGGSRYLNENFWRENDD